MPKLNTRLAKNAACSPVVLKKYRGANQHQVAARWFFHTVLKSGAFIARDVGDVGRQDAGGVRKTSSEVRVFPFAKSQERPYFAGAENGEFH